MPSAADLIKVAQGEVGYLEKATNANLDSKTANPGRNNWTKYGAWYGLNGGSKAPWCAMFVSWCAYKINATNIVGKSAAVAQFRSFHQNLGQYHTRGNYKPKAGDLIIFTGDSHIGIVTSSSSSTVYTIEGNTSASGGVVANGQGVFQKSYSLNYNRIAGYASPKYTSSSSSTASGTPDHYGATVVRSTSFYMHSYSNTSRPSIPMFKSKFQRDLDCSTVPYLFIPATYDIKGKKGGNWVGAIALIVDNIKKKYTYAVVGDVTKKGKYNNTWSECSNCVLTRLGYSEEVIKEGARTSKGVKINASIYVYANKGIPKWDKSKGIAAQIDAYGEEYGGKTEEVYTDNAGGATIGSVDIRQYINWNALTPYLVTVDRNTSNYDFSKLKDKKVVGTLIEAGYMYDSLHNIQKRFRNSKVDLQVAAAQKAEMYWGFFITARARTKAEVKKEVYEASFMIRKYPPLFGVWLTTNFFYKDDKSKTQQLLDWYQEELMNLGLVGKMGLLTTNSTLDIIDWEDTYCKDWHYWMIDHVKSISEIEQLLDPEFWAYGTTQPASGYNTSGISITGGSSGGLSQYSEDTFVGDSRTVGYQGVIPGIHVIAKSGATYAWLVQQESAINLLRNQNIIFWWGANDFLSGDSQRASKYAAFFNKVQSTIGAYNKLYVASCGPFESPSNLRYYSNQLVQFNNDIRSKLNANIGYIDVYNYLMSNGFKTVDGVHYTTDCTKKIYTYITKYIHGGS